MNWIINAIVWLLSPCYKIHERSQHRAASEGAMFYVEDVKAMRAQINDLCCSIISESSRSLFMKLQKDNQTFMEQEREDLKTYTAKELQRLTKDTPVKKKGRANT